MPLYRSERHLALDTQFPSDYPSCSGGSWVQGKKRCETKQACQSPEAAERSWRWSAWMLVMVGAILAGAFFYFRWHA